MIDWLQRQCSCLHFVIISVFISGLSWIDYDGHGDVFILWCVFKVFTYCCCEHTLKGLSDPPWPMRRCHGGLHAPYEPLKRSSLSLLLVLPETLWDYLVLTYTGSWFLNKKLQFHHVLTLFSTKAPRRLRSCYYYKVPQCIFFMFFGCGSYIFYDDDDCIVKSVVILHVSILTLHNSQQFSRFLHRK